jgi:hypothetical protein
MTLQYVVASATDECVATTPERASAKAGAFSPLRRGGGEEFA